MIGYEAQMAIDHRIFWGKARPKDGEPFHPIAWHGLDVAAVFLELLQLWPDEAVALSACFSGPWEETQKALAVLVASHDIGKFAPAFQFKVPELAPGCLPTRVAGLSIDHGAVGLGYLSDEKWVGRNAASLLKNFDSRDYWVLFQSVFGHHGRPVADVSMQPHVVGRNDGPSAQASRRFFDAVYDLYGRPVFPPLVRGADSALSWRLAGLVALADWIGSDRTHFPYCSAQLELELYWHNHAQPKAKQALLASPLKATPVSPANAASVVMQGVYALTDGQAWAANIPLDFGESLFFLEDVMGAGKTEAALILAHRLMQAGQGSGLYVALPTMATANALFRRMAAIYKGLFETGQRPSLILAHGARDLDAQFNASLFAESLMQTEAENETYSTDPDDETASASCAQWLADDRRKTFFADVGVGTVDQALLALLPVKHCAVRQLGLRRRVLIIDEAHSYDAYMQREIEALVDHQARMGAPVIVLSATLPLTIKRRLASAWRKGAAQTSTIGASRGALLALGSEAYPLATTVRHGAIDEVPLAARSDLVRTFSVLRISSVDEALTLVAEAAKNRAAVARLCNTVDDAIADFRALKSQGFDAELFHARFAMQDRIEIEQRAVERFGKSSTPQSRNGQILVATQVIEQSLDVDFDLMVSDLAPVDLLLQRAGRVWRHARTERGWDTPTLAIVSDAARADASADWVAKLFPNGQWVYRDHARLWRSARELFACGEVKIPQDMRRLIEAVYAAESDDIPAALLGSFINAEGKATADRGTAVQNILDISKGYMPQYGAWSSEIHTPTRLSQKRSLLRLARIEHGKLVPYADDTHPRRAWALSEVSVSEKRFKGRGLLDKRIEAQAQAVDEQWQRDIIRAICVPLEDMGNGTWKHADKLNYSKEIGVEFTS